MLTVGVLLGDVAFALLAHGPTLAIGWAATSVLFARLAARDAARDHGQALTELGLGAHIAGALLVAVSQASSIGYLGQGPGGQVTATIALGAVAAAAFVSARLTNTSNPPWRAALDTVGLGIAAYLTAINLHGAELVVAWAIEAGTLGDRPAHPRRPRWHRIPDLSRRRGNPHAGGPSLALRTRARRT